MTGADSRGQPRTGSGAAAPATHWRPRRRGMAPGAAPPGVVVERLIVGTRLPGRTSLCLLAGLPLIFSTRPSVADDFAVCGCRIQPWDGIVVPCGRVHHRHLTTWRPATTTRTIRWHPHHGHHCDDVSNSPTGLHHHGCQLHHRVDQSATVMWSLPSGVQIQLQVGAAADTHVAVTEHPHGAGHRSSCRRVFIVVCKPSDSGCGDVAGGIG